MKRTLAAVVIGTLLGAGALSGGPAGAAQTPQTSPVVPPAQLVEAHGYVYWAVRSWQRYLRLPPHPTPCTLGQPGGQVFFLGGNGNSKPTCSIPAADYIVLDTPQVDCSTLEKDPYHGSTEAQLKRCARRDWYSLPVKVSVTLDGVALPTYVIATPVFNFSLPRKNILQSRKRHGRAAAYGRALILGPLPAGPHTVQVKVTNWIYREATYKLIVR